MYESMLERAYRAAAPVLVPWFGEERLRESLRIEIARDTSDDIAPEEREPEVQQRPEAVRIIRLDDDPNRCCLAEYRRAAEGEPRPHVFIKHRSFEIVSRADACAVRDAALRAFAPKPVPDVCAFRYEHSGDTLPPGTQLQTRFAAAPIRALHLPEGVDISMLRVEQPQTAWFYDEYERWFVEFWQRRPDLKQQVPIESREDIDGFLESGGLRLVFLGDELCGLIAAERRIEYGLMGWRMREKVIGPRYWGRGLSAAATVLFAQSLPHDADDALWGTMVPRNRASLNSALRIGREVIGSLHWLPR